MPDIGLAAVSCFPLLVVASGEEFLPGLVLSAVGKQDLLPGGEIISCEFVTGGSLQFVGLDCCLGDRWSHGLYSGETRPSE